MGKQVKNKKKKFNWKVFLVIAGLVFVAAETVVYFGFRVVQINYSGNKHYTEEQMDEYIFGTANPNALLYMIFGDKSKSIPFIQKYDVEVQWPDKINVIVYEKPIIGYISYMGCYMYFDRDGIVVESSSEKYSGVPEIAGLSFKSIVLDSKLEVGSDNVFSRILEITQAFDKYDLDVDKVYFDSSYNVTLYVGDVKVILGSSEECMDKLYTLKQMYNKLTGLKGTLYMDNYDGNSSSILFKKNN